MADRVERLERAIVAQKAFLHRVPDPDTRRQAETNLLSLIDMHETAVRQRGSSPTAGCERL